MRRWLQQCAGVLESAAQQAALEVAIHRVFAQEDAQHGLVEILARNGQASRNAVERDGGAALGREIEIDDVAAAL